MMIFRRARGIEEASRSHGHGLGTNAYSRHQGIKCAAKQLSMARRRIFYYAAYRSQPVSEESVLFLLTSIAFAAFHYDGRLMMFHINALLVAAADAGWAHII